MSYLQTAVAAILIALLVFLMRFCYDAGADSALADAARAQVEREAAIAAGFVKAVAESEKSRRRAIDELNELRGRPPVVITDVQTEIIERNVCKRFDRDFVGLLDAT